MPSQRVEHTTTDDRAHLGVAAVDRTEADDERLAFARAIHRFGPREHAAFERPALRARRRDIVLHEPICASEVVEHLASATEGFSYAYLKELLVSSMMTWVGDRGQPFERLLESTAELLRARTSSTADGEIREQHVAEDPHAMLRRRQRW